MQKSQMVLAKKYRLQVAVSVKEGIYDPKGQKKELHDWKLVPREWVEERNIQNNNEWYDVDEEKTEELMKVREENIKKNEQKKKNEGVKMHDLVDAIAIGLSSSKNVSTQVDEQLESTRETYRQVVGKEPSKNKKSATLQKEIDAAQASDNEE